LRGIPPETYASVGHLAASVTIADDRDDAGKSAPGSPIVEELGENRGS
jgi:hypothetical protein